MFSQQLHAQGKYQVASQRELTAADLQVKSSAELKIMRNEIFARYGYIFKTKDMKEYFGSQPWYRPSAADVTRKLTALEKKNVELIKKAEQSAAKSDHLFLDGRRVKDLQPYFSDALNYGSGDWAVLVFDDPDNSWGIYRLGVDHLIGKFYDDDYSEMLARKERLSKRQIMSCLGETAFLTGNGDIPTLGRTDQESAYNRIYWNNKTRGIDDCYDYWGDVVLDPGGRGNSVPVLLPTATSTGRICEDRIKRVLHNSNDLGLFFINDKDEMCFWSYDGSFKYTVTPTMVDTYVIVGTDRFVAKVRSQGKRDWYLYSPEHSSGTLLPIGSEFDIVPVFRGCDSDWMEFDDCFTAFTHDKQVRYIYNAQNQELFEFPTGTVKSDGESYTYILPDSKRMFLGCNQGLTIQDEDGNEVPLDGYRK